MINSVMQKKQEELKLEIESDEEGTDNEIETQILRSETDV